MHTTEAATTEYRTTTPIPIAFPVDDDELALAFEQAAREAVAAQTLASEAEQRAAAAADAFCFDPTADAHGSVGALRQLAVNARDRARESTERAAMLGAEQRRRLTLARLQELEPAASRDRLLAQAMEEARSLATDLHARMAQASRRMVELVAEQNAAAREAYRLAREFGMWRHDLRAVPLAEVNEWLATRVRAAFPPRSFKRAHGYMDGPIRFTVDFSGDSNGTIVAQVWAAEYLDAGERRRS